MFIKGVKQFVLLGGLFLFGLPFTGLSQFFYLENSVQIIDLSSSDYEHGGSIAFSPNGEQVAIGGSSGVYLFNSNSLSREGFIETEHWARGVAYSPDVKISIAQVVTFVTYILVPITIVALLIRVIYSKWKYFIKKPRN